MAEIRRGELTIQMAVTGTGTETSQTCKNVQMIYEYTQGLAKLVLFKMMEDFLGWNVDVGF